MEKYFLITFIFLTIYFVIREILFNLELKNIEKQLLNILNTDTNSKITLKYNFKRLNNFTNTINKDLTKIKSLKDNYKTKNNDLNKIITNITHDLRTPLTVIKGYLDLLKDNKSKKEDYLNIINPKLDEIISLTDGLYDYAKTSEISENIKKEKICINNTLEESIISYYEMFNKKGITPNISLCKKKVYKYLNKEMFIRIMDNVISNGIKYAKSSFEITLDENGRIIIKNDTYKEEKINILKLFDRFYTVNTSTKQSGVGLTIAKDFVEKNGGTIKIDYKNNIFIIEICF